MNRTLKFRLWNLKDKEWDNPALIEVWDRSGVLRPLYNAEDGGEWQTQYVIQQFSGYQDATGKDIYEGDIVQHEWPDVKSIVRFGRYQDNEHEYHCGWYYQKLHCDFASNGWLGNHWEKEDTKETKTIIGNIFENPELIA